MNAKWFKLDIHTREYNEHGETVTMPLFVRADHIIAVKPDRTDPEENWIFMSSGQSYRLTKDSIDFVIARLIDQEYKADGSDI